MTQMNTAAVEIEYAIIKSVCSNRCDSFTEVTQYLKVTSPEEATAYLDKYYPEESSEDEDGGWWRTRYYLMEA